MAPIDLHVYAGCNRRAIAQEIQVDRETFDLTDSAAES
jgi:hypothetical protein